MVHNLVHNLCESLVTNIGGVAGIGKKTPPTPITYLTQWQLVGNSEVHILPYPDGIVLPTGYKRCEYLESDGTAYIEIPFGFDKTDEIYAKVAMLDITHADKYFVAPKIWNDNSNRFGLGVHNIQIEGSYKNVFIMAYGNKGSQGGYLSPVILSDTEVQEWEYKNYICSIGGSTKDNSNIIFGSETTNLRLFYGYNSATKCQICEYKHKKGNTEYRFIPCLDNNDIPCMYDVINNQAYYNSASSGSFTYKLYPQPTEIWSCGEYNPIDGKYHILVQPLGGSIADIALDEPLRKVNNVADSIEFPDSSEIARFASYFNIPFSNINYALRNYNFYDYMSSTNTSGQYIDTGLCIGGTDSVDFRVKFFLQNAGGWFGAFDGQNYKSPGFYGTDSGGNSNLITLSCDAVNAWNNCTVISEVDSSLYLIKTYAFTKMPSFNGVNGDVLNGEISNATYTPTHNAFIFARNNAGTPSSTRLMSVYSLIVHGKGVFIVAKRKSDNAIGLLNLFDSNPATQLHTNQGSGDDFTLGSQITFEQLCSDIMDDYPDVPTETNDKALLTIRVEESGGELSPLDTPITELVDAPQIAEADSYTCVISQGGKAVEWTEFVANPT